MFRWLKGLFKRPLRINERSSEVGDDLTADERAYMMNGLVNKTAACPDCEEGRLLEGPQGCGSMNVRCSVCHQEFNIYFMGRGLIGERI